MGACEPTVRIEDVRTEVRQSIERARELLCEAKLRLRQQATTGEPGNRPVVSAQPKQGVIFSQRGGHVWVSWSTKSSTVNLGAADEVSEMMRDYLAQADVAERLLRLARTVQNQSAKVRFGTPPDQNRLRRHRNPELEHPRTS